ncbi:MAG: 16S rRNA (adenine(1518)-N(6)/adenine(1519)-N(6))-dimethyltransferase RsmA [Chitinophagaceae bacterium]
MEYHLKKSLGQHFLHDEDIALAIVNMMHPAPGLRLLEVGPGGGALTKYLLELPNIEYKAVEIDKEKVLWLRKNFPAIEGKIIEADVLEMRLPFEGMFSIIGNFPYNISSQILFLVLEWQEQVETVVGMFQREVAKRIASGPGSKEYGILSVLMQAFYDVEYLLDVPPTAFTPPPKVMSGVVRFAKNSNPHNITDRKIFKRLVKAAFNQRRKTLRNALRGTLPEAALTTEPLMSKRAEQLSVAQFADLYHRYLTGND